MELKYIRLDVKDFVAVVTIDSPPVNALTIPLEDEICQVFDTLTDRDDVRVAIFTGAGRVFCGGSELKARAKNDLTGLGERWRHNRSFREMCYSVTECKKPVIAAINGPAVGGGLCLCASCDILVTATTGALALPEIDIGLLGGTSHAVRLFGRFRARQMMFTGMRVPGPELYRLGIVSACVPPEELMDTAGAIARNIASKSAVAIKLAKVAANTSDEMHLRDGYRYEQDMTAELARYEDSREAKLAFVEHRAPVFKGR